MTDKVLTDDEKDALLRGVANGAVEVHGAAGPTYASVTPFEIGLRSRIVSDSFPRLQLLNQQFAKRMSNYSEMMLQTEVGLTNTFTGLQSYNEFCEQNAGHAVAVAFSASPLKGNGVVVLEPRTVGQLVEAFFGGSGSEHSNIDADTFTPGELSVSKLYTNMILRTIKEVWDSVFGIDPKPVQTEFNVDLLDIVGESDPVIVSEFELAFAEQRAVFRIVLPRDMVKPLVPIFEGQKRERDAIQDAKWEKTIRHRLIEAVIRVTSDVGAARLTIRDLIDLTPGDVIQIDSPTAATIFAQRVPILRGRFGVHAGRNAIETTEWVTPDPAT